MRHLGLQDGLLPVNQSITYSDVEGNLVSFPEPAVQVSCDVVITEPCPMPVPVVMEGYRQTMEVDVGHLPMPDGFCKWR